MTVGNNILCSTEQSPTFEIPKSADFPALLNDNMFNNLGHIRYHFYKLSEPLNGVDPDCVLKKLIKNPTPGNGSKPATQAGTLNNAIVNFSIIGDIANFVTSYLTTDWKTGNSIIINTATGDNFKATPFGAGYVVRWVDNNNVYTAGEGTSWLQSKVFGAASMTVNSIANYLVWQTQMQDFVKECECKK